MHIEYISLIWGNIKLVKDKACQQQKQQQPEPINNNNNNNNNSNICFNAVYPCRPGLAYCPWLWFLQHFLSNSSSCDCPSLSISVVTQLIHIIIGVSFDNFPLLFLTCSPWWNRLSISWRYTCPYQCKRF